MRYAEAWHNKIELSRERQAKTGEEFACLLLSRGGKPRCNRQKSLIWARVADKVKSS